MRARRWQVVIILGGILLLAGAGLLAGSSSTRLNQTGQIPAGIGYYVYSEIEVLSGGSLDGAYAVTTGGTVDLFVFTEAQYAAYPNAASGASLHAATDASSGRFDVSLPGPGKYYVVMDHGSVYEGVVQDVRLTVQVRGLSPIWFASGMVLLVPGIVLAVFGGSRKGVRFPEAES